MNFNIEAPYNSVSFGQTAVNITHQFYKLGLQPCIFPIGKPNIGCYNWITDDFKSWLESCEKKAMSSFSKKNPSFKLWHLNGSQNQVAEKQVLLTFHESSEVTPTEKNLISNNSKVLVTSEYTKGVFDQAESGNVSRIKLGFDTDSFKKIEKRYLPDGVIGFGLTGKLEVRKRHLDILRLWAKKFGNDKRYFLNCALFNPHIHPDQQGSIITQALEGKRYFNINFNPYLDRNDAYNDYLNSNHIILGLSGAEGWGLPEFQSVGLGKHSVILNATGYKEWANDENSVLVEPNGTTDMHDDFFFRRGEPYNQGVGFTWSPESFYEGIDKAIERFKANPVNKAGLKIQQEFTWANTANEIIKHLQNAS